MAFRASHFCQYETLVPGEKVQEGWTGFSVESIQRTADRNGDGKVDGKDMVLASYMLCPGDHCETEVNHSFEISFQKGSSVKWTFGGEVGIKKLLKLSGARESGGNKSRTKAWSQAIHKKMSHSYDLKTKKGEPSDKKELVLFCMLFKKVTLVDFFISKHPFQNKEERVVVWIPEGLALSHGPCGDCRFVKMGGVQTGK